MYNETHLLKKFAEIQKQQEIVKPKEITIKTERDIELSIKREIQSVENASTSTTAPGNGVKK